MGKFGVNLFHRWCKNKNGTTSIEFSMLAVPYFMLTIGLIEMSLMFTAASLLEGATGSAARMLRTGQIQQSSADPLAQEQLFRDAVCSAAIALIPCDEIQLEVQSIGRFGDYGGYQAEFGDGGDLESRGFDAGGSSSVLLIRVGYRYELMTPLMANLLGEPGRTSRYFLSTIVLQAEPYEFEGPGA